MPAPIVLVAVALGAAILLGSLAIPIGYWVGRWRADAAFGRLARELGAVARSDVIELQARGRPVMVRMHHPSKTEPRRLEIALPTRRSAGGEGIHLRPEGFFDRLGKRLAINREVQTGDERFDRLVYIDSNAPDVEVRVLLENARKRAAVLELFALGFSRVHVHEAEAVVAATLVRPRQSDFARAALERAASAVLVLAHGIEDASPVVAERSGAKVAAQAVLALVALLGGVLGGWVLLAQLRRIYLPLDYGPYGGGVVLGVVMALALSCVAALAVRGRSDSFARLGWIAAFLVAGLPGWGTCAVLTANAGFDAGPTRHEKSNVVARYTTTGKNAASYLEIAPYGHRQEPLKLEVDDATYERFHKGDVVDVSEGSGAFGWHWIRSIDPVRAGSERLP